MHVHCIVVALIGRYCSEFLTCMRHMTRVTIVCCVCKVQSFIYRLKLECTTVVFHKSLRYANTNFTCINETAILVARPLDMCYLKYYLCLAKRWTSCTLAKTMKNLLQSSSLIDLFMCTMHKC